MVSNWIVLNGCFVRTSLSENALKCRQSRITPLFSSPPGQTYISVRSSSEDISPSKLMMISSRACSLDTASATTVDFPAPGGPKSIAFSPWFCETIPGRLHGVFADDAAAGELEVGVVGASDVRPFTVSEADVEVGGFGFAILRVGVVIDPSYPLGRPPDTCVRIVVKQMRALENTLEHVRAAPPVIEVVCYPANLRPDRLSDFHVGSAGPRANVTFVRTDQPVRRS